MDLQVEPKENHLRKIDIYILLFEYQVHKAYYLLKIYEFLLELGLRLLGLYIVFQSKLPHNFRTAVPEAYNLETKLLDLRKIHMEKRFESWPSYLYPFLPHRTPLLYQDWFYIQMLLYP